MSNDTNTGEPAFPVQDASTWQAHGMTLRDYFAAKAMPSVLVDAKLPPETWPKALPLIADFAYQMADAMLKARDAK
jgi:hypothetical protein